MFAQSYRRGALRARCSRGSPRSCGKNFESGRCGNSVKSKVAGRISERCDRGLRMDSGKFVSISLKRLESPHVDCYDRGCWRGAQQPYRVGDSRSRGSRRNNFGGCSRSSPRFARDGVRVLGDVIRVPLCSTPGYRHVTALRF